MENFKIAYLIQAHNNPDLLERMICKLGDDNDYFVHIDRKSNVSPFIKKLKFKKNVFFLNGNDRIKVHWAGFSQVSATLSLIRCCISKNDENSQDYLKVVFISGVDYPIKKNSEIKIYFEKNRAVNFIRGMNISEADKRKYNYSIRNYLFFNFFLINSSLTRFIRKILNLFGSFLPKKNNYVINEFGELLEIYHGSSWWALNMDVIKYIDFFSKKDKILKQYFRYSMASDEKYFHTIFFNSKFSNTNLSKGPEAYVEGTFNFANLHVIDKSLTKWFSIDDFEDLKNSDKFFVRKVSISHSEELLNKIDKEIL
tara:strand:+ start:2962 stop:3897 length:936 start_codon:yes stop_codon:yes gene_type:complete